MTSRSIPDGYTPRQEAITTYGRSKSSFIRDFDEAFKAGNREFLQHFRVLFKDGTHIDGPDATKEKLREVAGLKPCWLIKTAFLDSRYWEQEKPVKTSVPLKKTNSSTSGGGAGIDATLDGADDVTQLRHQLALEQKDNESHRRQIVTLQETNDFLKDELTHRRKDMQELTSLIDTMRKALPQASDKQPTPTPSSAKKSANVIEVVPAKPSTKSASKQPRPSSKKKPKPTKHPQTRPKKPSWAEKHIPTFSRFLR